MNEIVTIKDLIEYLENNFKKTDRLAFYDEGGAWCELEHLPKDFIGNIRWMFNYVKDKRQHELNVDMVSYNEEDRERVMKTTIDNYKSVNDNDVVIF